MIEVKQLNKHFGTLHALQQVSFQVPEGAICGFIGPNGAGKTTTMRILSTLDYPDDGQAFINGYNVLSHPTEVRHAIGYMPDYYGTYPDMIVLEYLDFFARAYRLPTQQRRQKIQHVSDFIELTALHNRSVEKLSKGQKQRLSLARTLLSDPVVMILDEPAAGLDPRARVELRELLKILAQQGKTIFISSHILSELADFVDYIVIIDKGCVAYAGQASELNLGGAQGLPYAVEISSSVAEAKRFLLEQAAILQASDVDNVLHIRIDESVESVEALLIRMLQAGLQVRQFYQRREHLEEVFMALTAAEDTQHDSLAH